MTDFHEVRFPLSMAYGSTGGPERRTTIIELASGHEERNAQWRDSRRRYNAGYGLRALDDLHSLISFFEARKGRLHGFRFRDLLDWKSCLPSMTLASSDQIIGTGNGTETEFQLSKTYSSGEGSWKRNITKPVTNTILVEVNGAPKSIRRDWEIDNVGKITFNRAPVNLAVVKAGFEFDIPVRFDTDYLAIDIAAFEAGEIPEIPIVEVKV